MQNGIDYKFIQNNHSNYVFFRDSLSVYKIEDEIINDYIKGKIPENDPIKKKIEKKFEKANKYLLEIKKADKIKDSDKINNSLDTIVLIITRDCNLRCRYCYSVESLNASRDKMTIEIAKESIDFLLRLSPNKDKYEIVFFGGEPFLNFKLIQDVVEYAKNEIVDKLGKKVYFGLTTNGTVINDEIISFLSTHTFALQISMDGSKENHNKNRIFVNGSGSFDVIMKNAEALRNANIPFGFHPTFSPNSDIYYNVKLMEEMKTSFGFGFTISTRDKSKENTDFTNTNWEKTKKDFKNIADFYFERILEKQTVYCNNILNSLYKIDDKIGKNYSCSSGVSTLSILPDGNILPCQNFQNHPECIVGNIKKEFTNSKISSANVNEISDCNSCWVKFLCGGSCYFSKYEENNNFIDPIPSSCELTRLFWETMLNLYVRLQDENLLNDFLSNNYSSFILNV